MVHGEDDRLAPAERHHLGPGLLARPLLRQHEFATAEIRLGLAQQDRELQRKDMGAIEILMQPVVVPGPYFSISGVGRVWPAP